MFALKPISRDSVAGALAKAERYRLLNEPTEAESICRDILEIAPANREARISLILALTDEFAQDEKAFSIAVGEAAGLESPTIALITPALRGNDGQRHSMTPQTGLQRPCVRLACQGARLFEEAERFTTGRQTTTPILRWNACVRFLTRHKTVGPKAEDVREPILSE